MKIDGIKLILGLAIALLLGFLCKFVAPETDNREWISLAVGFLSISALMIPAMSIKYGNANRGVNIKVFSWIMVIAVIATNIIFSLYEYKIDLYIVIVLLLAVIGWSIIYGLYRLPKIV